MVNCCVPGCTNYSANTSKSADISYHKFPSDKQRRKTWLESSPTIEYAFNAVQLCLQWPFFAKLFLGEYPFAGYRREVLNADWRRTLCCGRQAVRPNHGYQAKIALYDKELKNLAFYNILYASISASLTCLVVKFNTHCHLSALQGLSIYIVRMRIYVLLRLSCFDFSLLRLFSWKIVATNYLRV